MDANRIRCYFGSHRVLSVIDGWYRPSRYVNTPPQLILRLLLRNGRRVIVRSSQVPGSLELWYAFTNSRRQCSESESSSDDSSSSSSDDDETEEDGDDDDKNDGKEAEKTTNCSKGAQKGKSEGKAPEARKEKLEGNDVTVVLERVSEPSKKSSKQPEKAGKDEEENKKKKNAQSSSSSSSFNSLFDSSPPATPGSSPQKNDKKAFNCTFTGCKYTCKSAGGLTSHFNTVHERGRKITCEYCGKQYSYSNMASHKKRCSQNPNKTPK